jgi:CheY-like chemotaxis protein
MKPCILIVEDDAQIALNTQKSLLKEFPNSLIETAVTEDEIKAKLGAMYFNVIITDLNLDGFKIDGINVIETVIVQNPFANLIVVSGYIKDYETKLKMFATGKIKAIIEKEGSHSQKMTRIIETINEITENEKEHLSIRQKNLQDLYAEAKNEKDSYEKGKKFERFVVMLFQAIGFVHIQERVIDKSRNETDLIIRNEINDFFFQKFSPYFLVECKNTIEKIDKNQFIVFADKLAHTNNMANLGFIITSSTIKSTTVAQEIRTSSKKHKIIFIAQNEIAQLIKAGNMLEELKSIVDRQVKNN